MSLHCTMSSSEYIEECRKEFNCTEDCNECPAYDTEPDMIEEDFEEGDFE